MSPVLERFLRLCGEERPKTDCDWRTWMERWRKAEYFDERLGLLHYGFKFSPTSGRHDAPSWKDASRERMLFYLDLADGCFDTSSSYRSSESGNDYYSTDTVLGKVDNGQAGLRQQLSRFAFHILCREVFKNREESDYKEPSWFGMIDDDTIVDRLVSFFQPECEVYDRDSDIDCRIASKFVRELGSLVWGRCPGWLNDRYGDHHLEKFQSRRARFVPILKAIDRLGVLLKWPELVNFGVLRELHRLVYAQGYYFPQFDGSGRNLHRRPVTIAEACYAGNEAAQIWTVLKTVSRETRRFRELQEIVEEQTRLAAKQSELSRRAGKMVAH